MSLRNSPEPDDSQDTAGHDDEVAEVVTKGHARENGEGGVELLEVSFNEALG